MIPSRSVLIPRVENTTPAEKWVGGGGGGKRVTRLIDLQGMRRQLVICCPVDLDRIYGQVILLSSVTRKFATCLIIKTFKHGNGNFCTQLLGKISYLLCGKTLYIISGVPGVMDRRKLLEETNLYQVAYISKSFVYLKRLAYVKKMTM